MTKREEVYKAIDSERTYQNLRKKQKGWSETHSVGDYLTMLAGYLSRAQAAWCDNTGEQASLEVVRKLAGICVACMEENGAPMREMPEDLKSIQSAEIEAALADITKTLGC